MIDINLDNEISEQDIPTEEEVMGISNSTQVMQMLRRMIGSRFLICGHSGKSGVVDLFLKKAESILHDPGNLLIKIVCDLQQKIEERKAPGYERALWIIQDAMIGGISPEATGLKGAKCEYTEPNVKFLVTVLDDLSTEKSESYMLRIDEVIECPPWRNDPEIGSVFKSYKKRGESFAGQSELRRIC